MQLVPQPLDGAAAVKDAALQRVGDGIVDAPRHGGHQTRAAADGSAAHVHQRKAAGAVGVLGITRMETGLAEEGRLLVARRAAHRHAGERLQAGDARLHRAVHLRIADAPGQHAHGDAQHAAQLRVPTELVDIEQHGAAGVGIVGDVGAGQLPDKPRLHRAEQQLALLRLLPCAGNVVQYPTDLGGGEIGVDQKAGGGLDAFAETTALQLLAQLRRAAALPHDGVVDRHAGIFVPDDGGLPLVGDADTGNGPGGQARDGVCRRLRLCVPDLHGVVLHPARLRVMLGEGILAPAHDLALPVKHDGP